MGGYVNLTGLFLFLFFALGVTMLTIILNSLPPHSITLLTMNSLKERIMIYARENNKLPNNLDEVPRIKKGSNAVNDAWGNRVIYEVKGNNYEVILTSWGNDFKEGGIGRNTDLIGRFHPTNDDNDWIEGEVEWALDPANFAPDYHTGR